MSRVIAPSDTWPWLRVTLLPLPWTWRLRPRLYIDDVTPWAYATFDWLCFHLSWSAQDRPIDWFTEQIAAPSVPGGENE